MTHPLSRNHLTPIPGDTLMAAVERMFGPIDWDDVDARNRRNWVDVDPPLPDDPSPGEEAYLNARLPGWHYPADLHGGM